MITQGVGYTTVNSSGGQSIIIDQYLSPKIDLPFYTYIDTTAEGTEVLRVNAGTVNNLLPTINGQEVGGKNAYLPRPSSSGYVYISIKASETANATFPSETPQITIGSSIPSKSKTTAAVAIARIVSIPVQGSSTPAIEITQLVSGSIWGERFECGTHLDYWFSRI